MAEKEKWLITGGAGYIGSHVAYEFLSGGKDVIIFDSMINGIESRIEFLRREFSSEIQLIKEDIRDVDKFHEVVTRYKPTGIVHTAALKSVEESFKKEEEYLQVNYHATKTLLSILPGSSVTQFIFSSTAAVYAPTDMNQLVKETHPTIPISNYGMSKLLAEQEISLAIQNPGLHGTSLRFFNAVGTRTPELRDLGLNNLIPILIDNLYNQVAPKIFGVDYPTPDGTCVRDYVDVRDIAKAHFLCSSMKYSLPPVMNVGTGLGYSVREVIDLLNSVSTKKLPKPVEMARRQGDASKVCADVSLIKKTLGFQSEFTLADSIQSII